MKTLIKFFAEKSLFAHLFTVGMIAIGIISVTQIQRDVIPSFELGIFQITTVYPGASAEDVERNVTRKVEENLTSLSGIKEITSVSSENLSSITVKIDINSKDKDRIKRRIEDAVNRVTGLPFEIKEKPIVLELTTDESPFITVAITGEVEYGQLKKQVEIIEDELRMIAGVEKITPHGLRDREVHVNINLESVKAKQISIQNVADAIRTRNVRQPAGGLDSYINEKSVLTLAQFRAPEELNGVIVRSQFQGPRIKVGELAKIEDTFEKSESLARLNGKPAISFDLYLAQGSDLIRTSDSIKNYIVKEKEHLMEGMDISYVNDYSKYVESRFTVVQKNLIQGLVLVLLVLGLFLNFKVALWVAVGIPVSLGATVGILYAFGYTLDIISMMGIILILGLIVDDGIVFAESIYQRWEAGEAPKDATINGIARVFPAVVTSVLTTMTAFFPLFFLPEELGKLFFAIPLVVCLALLFSVFDAVIALPAHLAHGLPRTNAKTRKIPMGERLFAKLRAGYYRFIKFVLRFRYYAVLSFVVLLISVVALTVFKTKIVLFPSMDVDQFMIDVKLPVGASLEATSKKMKEVEDVVKTLAEKEVESYNTIVGPGNKGKVAVSLVSSDKRTRTHFDIIDILRPKTDLIEGVESLKYDFQSGGPNVGKPLSLTIIGDNDKSRERLVEDIVKYASTLKGVSDVAPDIEPAKPEVQIRINDDALADSRLTAKQIGDSVRIALEGEVVSTMLVSGKSIDIRVQLKSEAVQDEKGLENLVIPNMDGRLIRLGDVASFETVPGIATIPHFRGERSVTIEGNIDQKLNTPSAVTEKVMAQFNVSKDYPGVRIKVGGEAEELAKWKNRLILALLIAVFGIYGLLMLQFNSVLQPLSVILTIPFGITGVLAAFLLHGEPLSIFAMLGVIGLSGVVVNDSLVLVTTANDKIKENPDMPLLEVVADTAAERFRPIILTSLTTVAGLAPLIYGTSDPLTAPMALALAWGLFFATPLTLCLLPCIVVIGSDIRGKINGVLSMFKINNKTKITVMTFIGILCISFNVQAEEISFDTYLKKYKSYNPTFKAEAYSPLIEEKNQTSLLGTKDWTLTSEANYRSTDNADTRLSSSSADEIEKTAFSNTLTKKVWATGGTITVENFYNGQDNRFNGSIPSGTTSETHRTGVEAEYRQPILKNFAGQQDKLQYDLAFFDINRQKLSSIENSEQQLLGTAKLFIDWVNNYEKEISAKEKLEFLKKQLEEIEKKAELNVVAHVEVIRAESSVRDSETNLVRTQSRRKALGVQLATLAGDLNIMEMVPNLNIYKNQDVGEINNVLKKLISESREIQNLKEQADKSKRNILGLKNKTKPQLDLVASAGFKDADSEFEDSFSEDKADLFAGIEFSYPLGNREAKGNLSKERLAYEQITARIKEKEVLIESQVRSFLIELEELSQVLELNRKQIESAKQRTEEEVNRYKDALSQFNFVVESKNAELSATDAYADNAASYQKKYLDYLALLDLLYTSEDLQQVKLSLK